MDINVKVIFTIPAEDEEDAKSVVDWFLTVAQELVDAREYHTNFPNWVILSASKVEPE